MRQRGAKAKFKKALVLGSMWDTFYQRDQRSSGIRPVTVVQSNAVAFGTGKKESWLRFDDELGDYVNPALDVYQVFHDNELILTYRKVSKNCVLCGQRIDDDKPCGCGAR